MTIKGHKEILFLAKIVFLVGVGWVAKPTVTIKLSTTDLGNAVTERSGDHPTDF